MSAALEEDLTAHDWVSRALCAKMDVEEATTAERKELCRYCPVKDQCLATALADTSLSGVWGGTTEKERKLMRSRTPVQQSRALPTKVAERRDRDERIRELSSRGASNSEIAAQSGLDIRTIRRVLARTTT